METRQVRWMAGLTIVLALMVALLVFGEDPQEPDDPEATAVVGKTFEPQEAVSLELDRNAGERNNRIVMSKVDGAWAVDEPFEAPADVDRVIQVLQILGRLENGIPVDGAPADFGLEPPAVVATVGFVDGSTQVLKFGSAAPVGHRSYMGTLDGGVAAVTGNPSEELLKRVQEYRDHRVFHYDPASVTRASIQSSFGLLEANKTEHGWFLTGFGPVDLDALDNWLTEMLNLRVDLFLDLDHETIESPLFRVEVDSNGQTEVMLVGRDTPYGKLVLFGEGLDGVVDHAILQMLERGPSDVGVHDVFPFDPSADVKVSLSGAATATWSPSEGEWPMSSADLEALENAQFAYKLIAPIWTTAELVVTIDGQAGPRTIEIGPEDGEGFRAARLLPGGPVRVPVEDVASLFQED